MCSKSYARWRAAAGRVSLPLLASSKGTRAREDGLGEEEGEGSGPKVLGGEDSGEDVGEDVGEVFSGELGGLGKRTVFLSKKSGWVNSPSKG